MSQQASQITNTVTLKGGVPKEGPNCVPLTVDFTAATGSSSVPLDLSNLFNQGRMSQVLTIYVDNSANLSPLKIVIPDSNQMLEWPANSQGYLPILQGSNLKFVASTAGNLVVNMQLLNFPVAVGIWSVNALPTVTNGAISVSDAALEATISGGAIQTLTSGNFTFTSGSGTITAGGTQQQIFAANSARRYWRIQNTSAGDLWINDNGGNAGVNVGDSFKVAAGAMYETAPGMASANKIMVFGATTGQQFSAVQA